MLNSERRPLLSRTPTHAQNGQIPTRSRCQTQLACAAVLCTEVFERIAFYGLIGNLVLFLGADTLQWSSYNAANTSMLFTGLCYMTSIFGGWLADSTLGRFKTICIFFIVYIAGYVFMPLLAYPQYGANHKRVPPQWCAKTRNLTTNSTSKFNIHPNEDENGGPTQYGNTTEYFMLSAWSMMVRNASGGSADNEQCSWAVYLGLVVIAIGTGAVKANVAPFGADQVRHEGPYMTRVFFNWFYWCINIGALLALGVLAYVQQEHSFFWGLVAPNICLIIALAIFFTGGAVYIRKPPGGSVITNIIKILCECCKVNRRRNRPTSTMTRSVDLSDVSPPPSCLDLAKVRYGGSFHDAMVDDVKVLGKIICVFLTLIPYWVVYFQMESTYVMQGLVMRLDFSTNDSSPEPQRNFKIPAAWLSLFDVVFLIILIPVMDRVIYPRLDSSGYRLSLRFRIAIGMIFAVLSVTTAGGLEAYRLNIYWRNDTENIHWQTIGGTRYPAANLSVLWQIPQYALIGISEVFASVAGLELAYTQAPRSMQGIIMGLFWFTQGIGSLVGTASISWFQGVFFYRWKNQNINCRIPCPHTGHHDRFCYQCHLDYYFFCLAGLQVVGLTIFIIISAKLDIGTNKIYRKHHLDGSSSTSNHTISMSPERVPQQAIPNQQRHIQKRNRSPLSSTSSEALLSS